MLLVMINRCASYSSVPTYCRLVPDPADQCCEKVECTAPNGQVLTPQIPNGPTVSPTLAPTMQHVIPVGTHQVFTGSGQPSFPVSGAPGTSGTRSNLTVHTIQIVFLPATPKAKAGLGVQSLHPSVRLSVRPKILSS